MPPKKTPTTAPTLIVGLEQSLGQVRRRLRLAAPVKGAQKSVSGVNPPPLKVYPQWDALGTVLQSGRVKTVDGQKMLNVAALTPTL